MSLASIGNVVDAGLATMTVPAGRSVPDGSVTDVAGATGFDATGEPTWPLFVQPAIDATITAARLPFRVSMIGTSVRPQRLWRSHGWWAWRTPLIWWQPGWAAVTGRSAGRASLAHFLEESFLSSC